MNTQESTDPEYAKLLQQTLKLQREAAREFDYALRRAKEAVAGDRAELALYWCRYGATVAGLSNPGFFYSHEMEDLLEGIGRNYLSGENRPSPGTNTPKRFLHVLTTALERGGHTRAVARWIDICVQHAPSEHHSVLLSMQQELPIPAWLIESVRRGGGELIEVSPEKSLLERAAELRSSSFEYDAIILYIHTHDPLPNVAFYDRPKPVLFYNHADHMFSLGTGVASVIADIRPVGHEYSMRFRSPAARKVLIPLPLPEDAYAPADKAEARRRLGLPADKPVALTIGELYKLIPVAGYNFSAVVQSLCKANSQVLFIAVGISESEPFPELKALTKGRFIPAGIVKDPHLMETYYRAADIYLDSFPCTSLTAVLDAARHGLPVQRLCNPYQRLVWCDDPGLDSVMRGAYSQEEYIAGALAWLGWPAEKRAELGSRFRNAILQEHCGAAWKQKWLDPAIHALNLPGGDPRIDLHDAPPGKEFSFLGLGRASWTTDWPASMFIAGAILSAGDLPRPIRISGILRSIKPLLFDSSGDGMAGKRLLILLRLATPIKARDIYAALRKIVRSLSWRRSSAI